MPVSGAALVAITGLRQMTAVKMDQVSQAMNGAGPLVQTAAHMIKRAGRFKDIFGKSDALNYLITTRLLKTANLSSTISVASPLVRDSRSKGNLLTALYLKHLFN